jgi:Protein of unknown function (DUF3108)
VTVNKCGVALTGILFLLAGLPGDTALGEVSPAEVKLVATYDVAVASFSLGEFRLKARFEGPSYRMQGEGHFSLFFGRAYKSSGKVSSTGRLRKLGPESMNFVVSWEGGGKQEERRISFKEGAVTNFKIIPPKKQGRRRVPVTKEQLQDVLDPLSAAFLHAKASESVCNHTVPIFDGQLRYDLAFSPKRIETLPEDAPRGLSRSVDVCAVKFVPVSGYKPDNSVIKYLSGTDRIEAWLVRLPGTDFYVPYWVGIPTVIGSAAVTLIRLEVNPK